MSIEQELAKYRASKRNVNVSISPEVCLEEQPKKDESLGIHEDNDMETCNSIYSKRSSPQQQSTWVKRAFSSMTILQILLWLTVWMMCIHLECGAIYFIFSVTGIIYCTMRPGSRKSHEPSAYSVFNPDCRRIDGTLTAEQFERELLHGAF